MVLIKCDLEGTARSVLMVDYCIRGAQHLYVFHLFKKHLLSSYYMSSIILSLHLQSQLSSRTLSRARWWWWWLWWGGNGDDGGDENKAQTGNYEVSQNNHSDLLFKVSSQILLKVRQCYNWDLTDSLFGMKLSWILSLFLYHKGPPKLINAINKLGGEFCLHQRTVISKHFHL